MQPSPISSTRSGRSIVIGMVILIGLITGAAGVYLWVHRVLAIPGMIYYPGGAFPFGPTSKPVNLGPFYIDETEVSNADFAEFCQATGCTPPGGAADLPVVNVTIAQARAFARWKGKRLPTAQEWERAARNVDALRYPWGQEEDPKRANVLDNPALNQHGLMPVKSFAATPEYQMAGNVWEMVESPAVPTAADSARFGALPSNEKWIQIRGGAFDAPLSAAVTYEYRAIPESRSASNVGFRCARDFR